MKTTKFIIMCLAILIFYMAPLLIDLRWMNKNNIKDKRNTVIAVTPVVNIGAAVYSMFNPYQYE